MLLSRGELARSGFGLSRLIPPPPQLTFFTVFRTYIATGIRGGELITLFAHTVVIKNRPVALLANLNHAHLFITEMFDNSLCVYEDVPSNHMVQFI